MIFLGRKTKGKLIFFFGILFAFFITLGLHAQDERSVRPRQPDLPAEPEIQAPEKSGSRFFIQPGFSWNAYNGDLGSPYSKPSAGAHLSLVAYEGKLLNGHFSFSYGQLRGQASPVQQFSNPNVNRFFSAETLSFHAEMRVNLLRKPHYSLFLSQGLGLLRYNPIDELGRNLIDVPTSRDIGEDYGPISLILPTGIGFLYLFPNQFGLTTQIRFLNPQSDYIDNISSLGGQQGNDQVLWISFGFLIPVSLAW